MKFVVLGFFAACILPGTFGYCTDTTVEPGYCLGKSEGNHVHPKGDICPYYVACGRGCEKTTHASQCSQDVMMCPKIHATNTYLYFSKTCPYDIGGCCDYEENIARKQGLVCYGSRNGKSDVITFRQTGYVAELFLVHYTGYVSCARGRKDRGFKGYWSGCNNPEQLNVWITEIKEGENGRFPGKVNVRRIRKSLIFPPEQVAKTANGRGHYELPPFDDHSYTIVFPLGKYVTESTRYRIWYGEDLFNRNFKNNAGQHCVEVYAKFH